MSKYVNVSVSASLSTDFLIEVPDEATEEEIRNLAKDEVVLPTEYPTKIHKFLTQHGINVGNLDSMLRSWNIDEIEYIIDGGNTISTEGEQSDVKNDL